ncbi:carbon starvation CstA family protein [Methanofollis ethanolicus]|uniref:carbon starvation CstA family protein n=1 Tax=Methanofollis ethanolicus TaxID=488124 RepID=UPI00082F4CE0|nr:carbon starvation CstA family protein [Methanofollis ethanolicus]
MFTLLALFGIIGLGYFLFAPRLERVFGAGAPGASPAVAHGDGVDYVPMGKVRVFLIQFLNIAGLDRSMGRSPALSGGRWPSSGITFGCILVGGVHDYCAGLLSYRNGGQSIPEAVGRYLGPLVKDLMRVYAAVLLLLVGTVFLIGAAKLLSTFEAVPISFDLWLGIITVYFILATLLLQDSDLFFPDQSSRGGPGA